MARVVHTGQAIVDIVLRVAQLPVRGGDVFADESALRVGGGFNVMAAAARDGAEVVYTGGHGTGSFGDLVRSALDAEGIDVRAPRTADRDTGFCVALVDAGAERTFVSTLGAEAERDVDVLDEIDVRPPDVVYVSGYSLYHQPSRDVLLPWLATLPAGVQVVLDASPMIGSIPVDVLRAIAPRVTVWSLNESEARTLLGVLEGPRDIPSESRDVAARLRLALHAATLVRTGPHGCWLVEDADPVRVPAPVVSAVDTNGAGDAHCGVVCAALSEGTPLRSAVRRANAAAALATTRSGPATAPAAEETDRVMRTWAGAGPDHEIS